MEQKEDKNRWQFAFPPTVRHFGTASVHEKRGKKGDGGEWHGHSPKPLWHNDFGLGFEAFA